MGIIGGVIVGLWIGTEGYMDGVLCGRAWHCLAIEK